jgi:DNA-binding response OmpR family regulator
MPDEALGPTGTPVPPDVEAEIITLGNLSLNLGNYRVTVDGLPIEVSYYEFELLRLLAVQHDRVVPYNSLSLSLWRGAGRSAIRRLNVITHRLRTKLAGSRPYVIETVRRRGYGLLTSREVQRG